MRTILYNLYWCIDIDKYYYYYYCYYYYYYYSSINIVIIFKKCIYCHYNIIMVSDA